jgi:hypothetical protein
MVAIAVLVVPAYIDPSTGGLLFQILAMALAAISGVIFFFSRWIKMAVARVRRFVSARSSGHTDSGRENP